MTFGTDWLGCIGAPGSPPAAAAEATADGVTWLPCFSCRCRIAAACSACCWSSCCCLSSNLGWTLSKGGVGGVKGVDVEGVVGGVSSGKAMGAIGSGGPADTGNCCGADFLEESNKQNQYVIFEKDVMKLYIHYIYTNYIHVDLTQILISKRDS